MTSHTEDSHKDSTSEKLKTAEESRQKSIQEADESRSPQHTRRRPLRPSSRSQMGPPDKPKRQAMTLEEELAFIRKELSAIHAKYQEDCRQRLGRIKEIQKMQEESRI